MLAAMLLACPLADPAVAASDVTRFGVTAAEAERRCLAARAHYQFVSSHWGYGDDWAAEAYWRYDCWDDLRIAMVNANDDYTRLRALARLRRLIGAQEYALGRMPDHLPVWRFFDR